ncbi:MAG: 2-amino-4-hydroxy-6-hydroxymethyldihydropteridine diphosphokinase [Pseudomonadota bacterium]
MATHWKPAYVGIGSNLDSPKEQVQRALDSLSNLTQCRLELHSSLYRSAPLDGSDQADYVNAVAALLTTLDPRALLDKLHDIEQQHGRTRSAERWGPRQLDLDLLVYSSESCDDADLRLPHPGIAERNFVLLPLEEIAPHMVIPGLGRVIEAAASNDNSVPAIAKLQQSR